MDLLPPQALMRMLRGMRANREPYDNAYKLQGCGFAGDRSG